MVNDLTHAKEPKEDFLPYKLKRSSVYRVTKGCSNVQFCVAAARNRIRFRTSKFKTVIPKNLDKSVLSPAVEELNA